MMRKLFSFAVASTLCCLVPFAFGEQRGKGEEKQNRGNEKQNKPGEKEGKGAAPHNAGGEKSTNERKGGNKPPGGAWSEGKPNANKQTPAGHENAAKKKGQMIRDCDQQSRTNYSPPISTISK